MYVFEKFLKPAKTKPKPGGGGALFPVLIPLFKCFHPPLIWMRLMLMAAAADDDIRMFQFYFEIIEARKSTPSNSAGHKYISVSAGVDHPPGINAGLFK